MSFPYDQCPIPSYGQGKPQQHPYPQLATKKRILVHKARRNREKNLEKRATSIVVQNNGLLVTQKNTNTLIGIREIRTLFFRSIETIEIRPVQHISSKKILSVL